MKLYNLHDIGFNIKLSSSLEGVFLFSYALIYIKLIRMLRFTNILPAFRYGLKANWANA